MVFRGQRGMIPICYAPYAAVFIPDVIESERGRDGCHRPTNENPDCLGFIS